MSQQPEPWEQWSEFDDTLGDAQPSDSLPPEGKRWLSEQRFVHGLLRSMRYADSTTREARIEAILAATGPTPFRYWGQVAAAALLLCAVVGALLLPGSLPEAEAAVSRAAKLFAKDVDRRFTFTQIVTDASGRETMRDEFELTMRPGMRLLITGRMGFGPFQADDFKAGCDGSEAWVQGGPFGMKRALPLAQAEELVAKMGTVLDIGYLDVQALLERLPTDAELRTVDRETDDDGRKLLRIESDSFLLKPRHEGRPVWRVNDVEILVNEATGEVEHLEAEGDGPRGTKHHMVFEYRGVVKLQESDYKRPW